MPEEFLDVDDPLEADADFEPKQVPNEPKKRFLIRYRNESGHQPQYKGDLIFQNAVYSTRPPSFPPKVGWLVLGTPRHLTPVTALGCKLQSH